MSGNFKIRYTMPLSSGAAIANKLESYLNSAATFDVSSASALPNLTFQRALHKQGVFAFNSDPTASDVSASFIAFDVSNHGIRVRLYDVSGAVRATKFLDLSNGPTGSAFI